MAKPHKYTEFEVGRRVNVSSTGHYSFHVHIKGYKTRWLRWDGHGLFWTQSSHPSFPAYVMSALKACLLERKQRTRCSMRTIEMATSAPPISAITILS
jgi:hypothetical protein